MLNLYPIPHACTSTLQINGIAVFVDRVGCASCTASIRPTDMICNESIPPTIERTPVTCMILGQYKVGTND